MDKNYDIVAQTMNIDRNSHVITMYSNFAYFSAFGHHICQTMNLKNENVRLCWDGSSKSNPLDCVINDDVDMKKSPPITFGTTKMNFLQQFYNL